jgi:hypothetical protein
MSRIEATLGNGAAAANYATYAEQIKTEINARLWRNSVPSGYSGQAFGHYVGWIDHYGTHDYFELDGNALAVALGIADFDQSKSIMDFIDQHFDYLVNTSGATRVLYGYYSPDDTQVPRDEAQNGAYWYLPSYYLAMAYHARHDSAHLFALASRVSASFDMSSQNGLSEWYDPNGYPRGGANYSWSLAYPGFLLIGQILGVEPDAGRLRLTPCIDRRFGTLTASLSVGASTISAEARPGCDGQTIVPVNGCRHDQVHSRYRRRGPAGDRAQENQRRHPRAVTRGNGHL